MSIRGIFRFKKEEYKSNVKYLGLVKMFTEVERLVEEFFCGLNGVGLCIFVRLR